MNVSTVDVSGFARFEAPIEGRYLRDLEMGAARVEPRLLAACQTLKTLKAELHQAPLAQTLAMKIS